jgi:hypothetical protein
VDTSELELFFNAETFKPFVITMVDGYALPVEKLGSALMGITMIVAKDRTGHLVHIPFGSIAHITQRGEEIG